MSVFKRTVLVLSALLLCPNVIFNMDKLQIIIDEAAHIIIYSTLFF